MINLKVLDCVKSHGQIIDRHIAEELSMSIDSVKAAIDDLTKAKKLYTCNIIHFKNGHEISGILCRMSGYMPPASAGRKAKE